MIDVKKLVVAFLVLAAIASSSALVLLGFGGKSSGQVTTAPSTALAVKNSAAVSLGNVFAQSTGVAGTNSADASNTLSAPDPNNLTSQLADSYADNLIASNPNGPRDMGNGNESISAPSMTSVLAELNTSTLANLQIPDWDFDAAMITTRIGTDSSDQAAASYSSALADIINKDFLQTNLQSIVNNTSGGDPTQMSYAASEIDSALTSIASLTTPKNFEGFQKSFVKLLLYEKNVLALGASSSGDPVKTALILQGEEGKYQAASQSFQTEWQQALTNKAFALAPHADPAKENAVVAVVNSLFGIQEAHAQFGGIVFDPTLFGQLVWEFVQSELLQILKNTIVTLIQNRVLALIRNNGAPRFIQSWVGFATNAFNGAAGNALGQIIPGLCNNFTPSVTGWLQNLYPNANIVGGGLTMNGAGATNCTLQAVVPNVGAYYNNFNANGFIGFGALLSPNNNAFGAFINAHDQVSELGASIQGGIQSNAQAGSGFPSQGRCDFGGPPDADGICPDGSLPAISVTPGSSFSDTLNRNMNSNIDLIVNANNITGLLATITGALLQQVINSGVNGLLGAATAGTGAGATPPPPATPLACNVPVANGAVNAAITFTATGGTSNNYTWNAPGGNPAAGTSPLFTTTFPAAGVYNVTVTNNGTAVTTVNCGAVTIQ